MRIDCRCIVYVFAVHWSCIMCLMWCSGSMSVCVCAHMRVSVCMHICVRTCMLASMFGRHGVLVFHGVLVCV